MKNTEVGSEGILLNLLELLHPPVEEMDERLVGITNAKVSLLPSLINNRECIKERGRGKGLKSGGRETMWQQQRADCK